MIPHRADAAGRPCRATCALCGGRDAAEWTEVDGRRLPACYVCLAPPPQRSYEEAVRAAGVADRPTRPYAVRGAVVALLRGSPGLATAELAELLGVARPQGKTQNVPREERRPIERLRNLLLRMVDRGELEGEWDGSVRGYRYRVPAGGAMPAEGQCRRPGCTQPHRGHKARWMCADHRREP